jgi:type VI secretion system secreted protein Hcp
MAVNAYLKLDTIEGPSTSKKNYTDIFSFSFGASMSMTSETGKGLTAGRANVQDITIMKQVDASSPLLFQACVSGDYFKTGEILYDKALGQGQEDYLKIDMTKVYVTSHSVSGSNENPTESVTFAFEEINFSYNPDKDGKQQGWVTKGFNLATLKQK